MSKRMAADVTLRLRVADVVAEGERLTGGGADLAIEAFGGPQTFESSVCSRRRAGTLFSVGVYSGKLQKPNS